MKSSFNQSTIIVFMLIAFGVSLASFQNCSRTKFSTDSAKSIDASTAPVDSSTGVVVPGSSTDQAGQQTKLAPVIKCDKALYYVDEDLNCFIENADHDTICSQSGTVRADKSNCLATGWIKNTVQKRLSIKKKILKENVGRYVISAENSGGSSSFAIEYVDRLGEPVPVNPVQSGFLLKFNKESLLNMEPDTLFSQAITDPIIIPSLTKVDVYITGLHGFLFEIGLDGTHFVSAGTTLKISNGQKIFMRGRSHGSYRQEHIPVVVVSGAGQSVSENIHISTNIGCDKNQIMPMDTGTDLAPHTFSQGMRAGCFDKTEITNNTVDSSGKWRLYSGILVDVPKAAIGGQFIADCSRINRAANSNLDFWRDYTNPYSGALSKKHPHAECSVSGTISYSCNNQGFWIRTGGSCDLR